MNEFHEITVDCIENRGVEGVAEEIAERLKKWLHKEVADHDAEDMDNFKRQIIFKKPRSV
jgi:hypothetical protein